MFSFIVGMFLNKSEFLSTEISVADSRVLSIFKSVCWNSSFVASIPPGKTSDLLPAESLSIVSASLRERVPFSSCSKVSSVIAVPDKRFKSSFLCSLLRNEIVCGCEVLFALSKDWNNISISFSPNAATDEEAAFSERELRSSGICSESDESLSIRW